jgi:serine protease Do
VFMETGRWPAMRGSLAGLSGAPVLDAHGRVLGVTVAENPRHRRLYATTPASLHAALARAHVAASAASGEPVTPETWRAVSDDLRERLSVAEVECLAR